MLKQKNISVAIYARVSTREKQEVENQLRQLREYCQRCGHTIFNEYIDKESGAKGRSERQAFSQMFKDASKRKFDLILFWSLDRFTREGLQKTIFYLQQLDGYGVNFHSYTEEYLQSDNELVRNILLAVLSSLASIERKRISERTKAGLATVKARGKTLGRPTKQHLMNEIATLKERGFNKSQIAKKLKTSRDTVIKYWPQQVN